jgi:tetratricopeptide (TPR) repeat protein
MRQFLVRARGLLAFGWFLSAFSVGAQNTLSYTSPDATYQKGMAFLEQKNYASARQEFQYYLEARRDLLAANDFNAVNAEYYVAMSALYLNEPDAEVLAERFVNNHREHPKANQIFADLGTYYFNQREYAKAIPYLQKATSDRGRYQLALAYYQTNAFAEALNAFDRIKNSSNPEFSEPANYYAGVIRFKNADYAGAVRDFKRVENAKAYQNEIPGWIAHALYRQGQYDQLVAYTEPLLRQTRSGKRLDELALLTADVYFQRSNYEKAAAYYKQYASLKANRLPSAAAYRYGYALFKLNDFNGAINNLKGMAAGKDTLSQYAAYYLGISYLNTENPTGALAALDQARRLNFNAAVREEAAFNHAKVQYELGNGADAVRELDEFIKTYPKSAYLSEAKELKGDALLISNNYAAILQYLDSEPALTARQKSQYQQAAFNLATSAYNAEQYPQAVLNFDKALKYTSDSDLALASRYWKAESFSGEQKYADAIPIYNQLLASNANSQLVPDYKLKSRYALGYAYYNTKEYDKAMSNFRSYADLAKSSPDKKDVEDALIRLADTYFVGKNYDEAIKYYDQVIAQGKTDQDYALYYKGLALEYTDRHQEAKAAFERLASQYPTSRYADDALFQSGVVEQNSLNYQGAVRQFTRLIQEKSKSTLLPAAYVQRAIAYTNLKQYDPAITDYKTVLAQFGNSKSAEPALLGIQDVLNTAGRPEEFSVILKEYERRNPGDQSLEKITYESAKNLYFNEKYTQAIEALNEFAQKYSGSSLIPEAKYYVADSYFRTGDRANALRFFNQVVAENKTPFVARSAYRAAELELADQNYPRAIRNFQTLIAFAASKKDVVNAWLGMMEAYHASAKYDSSAVYAREILNGGNVIVGASNKAQLYLGKNAMAQGDTPRAMAEFEKTAALAKDAAGAEAKYNVALLLYRDKKCQESRDKIINELREQFSEQRWIDQGFLLLSDVYVCLNEPFQARATLNSIIEGAENQEVIAEAKRKLTALDSTNK